jgi:3-dehydroquinate synthase
MKKVLVRVKPAYPLYIGSNSIALLPRILRELGGGYFVVVITNRIVRAHHGKVLEVLLKRSRIAYTVILIQDSESAKNWDTLKAVLERLATQSQGKRPLVVGFGGGVVTDIAGFAASIFKRGIPYVAVPTTLLGQVDAAIGGKTGIDLAHGKNLVGAFYQPRAVIIDTCFLKTLPPRVYRDGLAEVVKYAMIRDRALFSMLKKDHSSIMRKNPRILEAIVARCAMIKADIVAKDEKETKSLRTVLNFGHTVAHGIECASGYSYSHGSAVAVGMLAATLIAHLLAMCRRDVYDDLKQMLESFTLPVAGDARAGTITAIRRAMRYDKKSIGARNRFVLPLRIGTVAVRDNVPEKTIEKALEKIFSD